ncbi:hypothetical protein ACFLYR_08475 [Chloroflexota bacterium]
MRFRRFGAGLFLVLHRKQFQRLLFQHSNHSRQTLRLRVVFTGQFAPELSIKGEGMANKMAFVIWDKCHPEQCGDGTCLAAKASTRKLLKQEASHEAPMMESLSAGIAATAHGPVR